MLDMECLIKVGHAEIVYADFSDMHRAANAACASKYAQITINFRRITRSFFWIVRELHGRSTIDRRHLAND